MPAERPRLIHKPARRNGPLHVRYRPRTFDTVIGHRAQVQTLAQLVQARAVQSFLISGPSGVGKTTLARIAAQELGCRNDGLLEIDAATYSGIDSIRHIQSLMRYRPFGSPVRCIVMDEAHRLSGSAWDALLLSIEEPPDYVFWLFCTTDVWRVPETIQTRCVHVKLEPLSDHELKGLLKDVMAREQIRLAPGIVNQIVRVARGSPRQALVLLATVEAGLLKAAPQTSGYEQTIKDAQPKRNHQAVERNPYRR